MDILYEMGDRLKEYMTIHSLNARQFSELSGINRETLRGCIMGCTLLNTKNTLLAADCIPCSLEYLVGNTDKILDFTLKPRTPFYDNLNFIMELRRIKKCEVLKTDGKIDYSYYYRWKKGELPKLETLNSLAKYLRCTMDMLMGREKIE